MQSGVRIIAGAGTSTAAFVAPLKSGAAEPRPVRGWQDFTRLYPVGAEGGGEGGGEAGANLAEAVYGFFANGGTECYVVGTGGGTPTAYTAGLTALEAVADVNIVVAPDLWQAESEAPAIAKAIAGHCARLGNRMALLHTEQGASAADAVKTPALFGLDDTEAQFTAVYHPWIEVPGVDGTARTVPACGHIAGIWARTDAERGVFKAPANQNVRGATAIEKALTDDENGELNAVGVNCLRVFPDRGLLVWGARTLSTSRDWKYLNVRRLVNHLTDSIRAGATWAVFEPNDERLWASLRSAVASYLSDQWRQGALVGRTPDEAFYVICDQTNNPAERVKAGQVAIDIGIAPIRPAEFIAFRVVQEAGTGQ
ncbi:phage tail sheath family protein [Kitasatospora sp. NPDC008115]|uniref:phage tail sheath family protein n=1 Tax=Kitasatospora sp. NPDC008115 TaxID=3364022 RepID=UPI0036EBB8D4